MLPVLLERDHGQQARPGEAAGQNVERGWSLRYRLTSSAGELLSDVLHHLPLPRHRFKRLRHILAELGEPGRAAAREGFSRVKPRTAVVSLAEAATFSAARSSSAAAASSSSSSSSSCSRSRTLRS